MNAPVSLDEIRRQIEAASEGHRHGQRGLFALADLPQRPSVESIAVNPGWPALDDIWKLYPGQFTIVTGTPNHGKSILVLNTICNLAKVHGWASYLYVPENEAFLRHKMRRIYGRSDKEFADFAKNYCFIQSAEIQSYNDEPKNLGWVLDRAIVGIKQDGVRLVVIDPWNELEHAKPRDQAMTDYVRDCLMYLKAFCRAHHVAMIMVAHPTKAHASDNRPPTLYDIEQSAAWFNKSDNGLIVSRDAETSQMKVISAKVRERGAGRRGSCLLMVNDQEQVTDLSGLAL